MAQQINKRLPGQTRFDMPAAQFCELGAACYGARWKAPLARRLGRSWSWVNDVAKGKVPVPEETAGALYFLSGNEADR